MLSLFLALSCAPDNGHESHVLNIAAFEKKLDSTPDRVLLDVRTETEYRGGHFPEATLADVTKSDFREQVKSLNKSTPVFVYCASGIRSEKAVEILNASGFQEVYELEGGFDEWAGAGKPFVKD